MKKIFSKKVPSKLLHIINRLEEINERTNVAPDHQFLQLATMRLDKGKTFLPHKHIWKNIDKNQVIAQESWIIVQGSVCVHLYDIDEFDINNGKLVYKKNKVKAPINKDKKQAKKPTTNKEKEKDKQKDIKKSQPPKKAKPSLKKDKVVKEDLKKTAAKTKEKEVTNKINVAAKEPEKKESPNSDKNKEKKEVQKTAKDWGRASNDPRNKD